MASSVDLMCEDTVLHKDSLSGDYDFYNDSEEDDIDELDALLEDGSKADELDDILADTSNRDVIVERRNERIKYMNKTNNHRVKFLPTPSPTRKLHSRKTRRPATMKKNGERLCSITTSRTKENIAVDNSWKDRNVTIPKPPRLATMEKNGDRLYSTVSPAKEVVAIVENNWKERHVTIPKTPRLATMEKNGERSYSTVSPAKEVIETVDNWKDRQLTIPQPPRLATMEKNGDRLYSTVSPAKEVVETVDNWKNRQLTVPQPPRLATMEKNGERSYSTVSPAREVIETVDNWKNRQLTVPQPPRLSTMEKNGEKTYSCSCSSKEETEIPSLVHSMSSYSKSGERKPTIPQSPRLKTMEKYGDRTYSCAASPMRGIHADYPAWTEYKERLIEQGILRESSPSARPLKLTIPSPFHLSSPSPKTKKDIENISPKYEFKALPLPNFSFNDTIQDRQKVVTVPEPFDLSCERSTSRPRSHSPQSKSKDTFRALPLPKHILRSLSPSPRAKKASIQSQSHPHHEPRARIEENSENEENEPYNLEAPRVPDVMYATPPTNAVFFTPLSNSSQKNDSRVLSEKKLTSPPKTKITSPRSMNNGKSFAPNARSITPKVRSITPKPKSTGTRFKAKKMPDFSKPFVPKRRTETSPIVKKVIPSPHSHQFKARKMPDFAKPFTPKKRTADRAGSSRVKEEKNQAQAINVNSLRQESLCQEKEETNLKMQQNGAEVECEPKQEKIEHNSISRKFDEEDVANHASNVKQTKDEHEAKLYEIQKAADEVESNTQMKQDSDIAMHLEGEVLTLPNCAAAESGDSKSKDTEEPQSEARTNDVSSNQLGVKEELTNQQTSEILDPLSLVMERLNRSLQKFQAYEEDKAAARRNSFKTLKDEDDEESKLLDDKSLSNGKMVDLPHPSDYDVENSNQVKSEVSMKDRNPVDFGDDFTDSEVTNLFRGGWHRAPEQGSPAEPNNDAVLTVDTKELAHNKNVSTLTEIPTPESALVQRRQFEDLVHADTPKTSNNYLGTIDEEYNQTNVSPSENERDNNTRQIESLFNPSTEDSVFDNDEDSSTLNNAQQLSSSVDDTATVVPESQENLESPVMDSKEPTKRKSTKEKVSQLQSNPQTQALISSQKETTYLNNSNPLQIVSKRETKLLVTKEQKTKNRKNFGKNVVKQLNNKRNAMKERSRHIREKERKSSIFDSQKFIYRFCCATASRQPSPTRNFVDYDNNFAREDNNHALDDGSMKELKLVFK